MNSLLYSIIALGSAVAGCFGTLALLPAREPCPIRVTIPPLQRASLIWPDCTEARRACAARDRMTPIQPQERNSH